MSANRAGLRGTVVPVWDAGGGRMGFVAPQLMHLFFNSLDLAIVARNINKRLTCSDERLATHGTSSARSLAAPPSPPKPPREPNDPVNTPAPPMSVPQRARADAGE